ncbi:MAG: MBL fold metallo-hydrolase [Candidatus Marinimicrobia bacterium]|nr:MBL fold metallo-hydrolase [Candidatus Neomarinimicrobiota bacterium]
MRRYQNYLSGSIFISLVVFFQIIQAADFSQIYEAEDNRYIDMRLLSDNQASNGKYLEMGAEGSVTWEIDIPDSGWYNLKIRYQSPQGEKENILVKNQVKWRMGFGWTDEWTFAERLIALNAGPNTIELAANWGGINIDYLLIDPINTKPIITPSRNVYYSTFPRDIYVKVNTYGRVIESVTTKERSLLYSYETYPFEEEACLLKIDKVLLDDLLPGEHLITVNFNTNESVDFRLMVMEDRNPAALTIIAPDVNHGNSVLIIFPTGKTMLVDCGKSYIRDKIIIPLLRKNNIEKIDYFVLTHYHEDHDSGDRGATIRDQFNVEIFWDYQSFNAGDVLEIEDVQLKILNAYSDGTDENTRSLAIQLKYNGFIYMHDGDIYANNQKKIMDKFPNDMKAHVYLANHHFHGSTYPDYLRIMKPEVVLIQAEQALYARSTYTKTYLIESVEWLRENKQHVIETLPAIEVGTCVIRVNSGNDWDYETYKDSEIPFIPFLPQNRGMLKQQLNSRMLLKNLPERIKSYRQIVTEELQLTPQSGDHLSATVFLQLENLERSSKNPAENEKDIFRTETELKEIIEWIRNGKDYFQEKRGRIKIGYLSEIDSTIQPFDLMIPNHYDKNKSYGLMIYLHGKEDPIQKYRNLLWANEDPGLDELGVFKVAVYGRRNCWYQGAGEEDVFRVIKEIQKLYPIDSTRIYLMGASMGGFGSWYIGLHYADQFAAISPICGRAIKIQDFYDETISPYNYIENALHLPARIYHGEIDPVISAEDSRAMAAKMKSLKYEYVYTEFANVKHDSWNNARADSERLPYLIQFQSNPYPDKVINKCFYLRHGKAYWTNIASKIVWKDFAELKASIMAGNRIEITTANIDEFQIDCARVQGKTVTVNIDGQQLEIENSKSWFTIYRDAGNSWEKGHKSIEGLHKRKYFEGPWIDAEQNPFVIVYGTNNPDGGARLQNIGREILRYYAQFDMDPKFIPDSLLDAKTIASCNLHLLGTPVENLYLEKIQGKLPVEFTKSKFIMQKVYSVVSHGLRMIYPNPANPDRYVRIDVFPENIDNFDILQETVADFLVYTIKKNKVKIIQKDFFDSSWMLKDTY